MIPSRKMSYFENWCFSEIFIPFYTFSANGSYPEGYGLEDEEDEEY